MIVKDLELPYLVEPMTVADLDSVMAIETVAHSAPWPASAYQHELEQNTLSHYYVLVPELGRIQPVTGVRGRIFSWLRRPERRRLVLGYGGFWLMVGEAHISTIAIAPGSRGK